MLPCVCPVIDHRWRQNVVRTSVTHSAAPRVPLFCSYHVLTSSVIYYWTDARQHGIYLLSSPEKDCFRAHWLTFWQPERKSSSESSKLWNACRGYKRAARMMISTIALLNTIYKRTTESIESQQCALPTVRITINDSLWKQVFVVYVVEFQSMISVWLFTLTRVCSV